jgi:multidrug efflux pump
VSLIAVLIPLLFMGDIVGRLFREFAVTLAVTILVSAFVSLTLTPMMAAKLLRHKTESEQNAFYRKSEEFFEYVIAKYGVGVKWVLRHQTLTLLVTLATFVLDIVSVPDCAEGIFPGAGYGCAAGITEAPQTISFAAMSQRQQELAKIDSAGSGCGESVFVHRD